MLKQSGNVLLCQLVHCFSWRSCGKQAHSKVFYEFWCTFLSSSPCFRHFYGFYKVLIKKKNWIAIFFSIFKLFDIFAKFWNPRWRSFLKARYQFYLTSYCTKLNISRWFITTYCIYVLLLYRIYNLMNMERDALS